MYIQCKGLSQWKGSLVVVKYDCHAGREGGGWVSKPDASSMNISEIPFIEYFPAEKGKVKKRL
jgi:hypothetical protein